MQLICNQKDLDHAISIVQKAISAKTTHPILTGILLEAKDGSLKLTGNDLNIGIEKSIKADVIEEGVTVVSSRIFGEFIKKLPSESINLSMKDNKLTVECFKSHIDLITYDPIEYPELPQIQASNKFEISKPLFKSMIRQTIFATSQDEGRPILMGSYLEIKDQVISLVGIDGFRVAIRTAPIQTPIECKMVIPAKTLNEVSKLMSLNDNQDFIEIFISPQYVLFQVDDIRIISRLLEGEYVKYSQMIPTDFKTKLEINNDNLLQGIERVSLVAREGKNNAIKLSIQDKVLELSSIVEIGAANEEIPLNLEGKKLDIGFKPKYLVDVLKVIDQEIICMEFVSNISPCIIKPKNNPHFTYLILPVRIPNS